MSRPSVTQAVGHSRRRPVSRRLVLMIPAGLALLAGLDAGLLRFGLPAPVVGGRLADMHGMVLVLGFVATLVSLERATALGRWYGYLAPLLLGVGGVLLILPIIPLMVGQVLLVLGCAAFTLLYVPLWRRQYDYTLLAQLLAASLALAGAIIWLGQSGVSRVVPWLIGFIVLTIAAERVELARITMGAKAPLKIFITGCVMTATLVVGLVDADLGAVLLGLVLLYLCAWLVRHDVARRTIRTTGVTRYMAACILAGYFWLTLGAVLLLFGSPSTGPMYDAVTHAVLLGYAFSMIMAHATTILPAVLGISLPYRAAFWVPVGLLQVALIVRLLIGDLFSVLLARQIGGFLGVVALLLFLATAVSSAVYAALHTPRKI